jgi:ABC-type uncharacterized transport system substrate-binding protein
MSYGPSQTDLIRRGATYVDRILRGAKPADLPVEQPNKYEFVINFKAAKALRLTIRRASLSGLIRSSSEFKLPNITLKRTEGTRCSPRR